MERARGVLSFVSLLVHLEVDVFLSCCGITWKTEDQEIDVEDLLFFYYLLFF